MAAVNTFKCDECGALKKEANHWFKAVVPKSIPFRISIMTWDQDAIAPPEDIRHLCSEQCACKLMCKTIGAPSAKGISD